MGYYPVAQLLLTMRRPPALLNGCFFALACLGLAATARAASTEWKDNQGGTFKGTPVEALGPFALFQTGPAAGRVLAWRALAPADCIRFYEQTRTKPARSDDWAKSRSVLSMEITDRVKRLQGDELVPAGLAGRPEPEFLILFFANNAVAKSWDMLGHSIEPFNKLQQSYPGQVEGLYFGMWHTAAEHNNMAISLKLPWLVANFRDEDRLGTVAQFAPLSDPESFAAVVVNRDGVPVAAANNPEDKDLTKLFADLSGLLDVMRPGNPRSWPDRVYYLRAIQPVAFVTGRADPVLVGNPLIPEGLRQRNIRQVDAEIDVDGDGRVTAVTIKPDGGVSPEMVAPLSDALKKACVFVPAVDNGKFVAGSYRYHLEVYR